MYDKEILKNGLRLVTHHMGQRNSIALGILIGAGGRYENTKIKGVAHFIEHMAFKGSQKYACEEIKEKIEGVGGSLNAFTSEEQTCFYAKIPSKHFEQTFDILADIVFFPKLTTKDANKEKAVIAEEIKMYADQPQHHVYDVLEKLMWEDHPLGQGLAGTVESVMGMSRQDLLKFHQEHYTASNTVIGIAGEVDNTKIMRTIKQKLAGLDKKEIPGFVPGHLEQSHSRYKIAHKKTEQMHLILGLPGLHEEHKDRYKLSLLTTILGGNMSSRLFNEVREKRGLAYSIGCSVKFLHDTGLFAVRAGVDNRKLVQAFDLIVKELNKVKKYGVTEDEFTRAKDYLVGQLLLSLEDTMDHMLWMAEWVMQHNKVKTVKEVLDDFAKIKRQDIQAIAQEIIDENKFNLAIVGPVNKEQESELKGILQI
ncbi:MAG: insulinase family protein [Candidatus Omnitrophica bacterium]|nr:insulinase family protein [Candidatus Omnitrophota bacterium]